MPYSHAHYAGNLVDGAYSLGLFGDVATEMCIRTDGDEGLFASYSDVQFRRPVRAGDVLEITAELVRVGHPLAGHGLRRARRRPRRRDRRAPRAPREVLDPTVAGHHGDRHGRRPRLTHSGARGPDRSRRVARDTPGAVRFAGILAWPGTRLLTCDFARSRRSRRG